MNPKAKLLYDQHDRKWLAERVCELETKLKTCERRKERYRQMGMDETELLLKAEADNAALRECILAMENDQACLPEDFSVTEYVAALQKQVEMLTDALEHCGYDPKDCIDCGGPPHNDTCRFWKLRHILSYWGGDDAE